MLADDAIGLGVGLRGPDVVIHAAQSAGTKSGTEQCQGLHTWPGGGGRGELGTL